MSSKTPRRGSLPRVRIKKAFNEGDVGYGRPPRTHQFKPGQSGNPKGRPKGAKNEATILNELLHRKIPIRESSRTRKIMVLEAILLRFTEDSLKSNTKSAAFLLNRHGALVAGEPQPSEITVDDREILSAFAESARHQEDDVMTREDQVLLDAVLRNDFLSFLRRCMATLNPGAPFLPNWHLDAIAYQLERVRAGKVTRLIVNLPPRHLKSIMVSVAFPAFLLGHEPRRRIFGISYAGDLSIKHASDFRSIVQSTGTVAHSQRCGLPA